MHESQPAVGSKLENLGVYATLSSLVKLWDIAGSRKTNHNIGLVRVMFYVLIPLLFALAIILVFNGVMHKYQYDENAKAREEKSEEGERLEEGKRTEEGRIRRLLGG